MIDDVFIMKMSEEKDVFTKNPIPHPLLMRDPNQMRKDIKESVTSEFIRTLTNFISSDTLSLQPQILSHVCETLDPEYLTKAITLGHYLGISKIGTLLSSDQKIQDQVFIHCKVIGCIMTSISQNPFDEKGHLTGKWAFALESLPRTIAGIELKNNTCRVLNAAEETPNSMELYSLLYKIIEKWGRSHLSKWKIDYMERASPMYRLQNKSTYNVYYIETNTETDS